MLGELSRGPISGVMRGAHASRKSVDTELSRLSTSNEGMMTSNHGPADWSGITANFGASIHTPPTTSNSFNESSDSSERTRKADFVDDLIYLGTLGMVNTAPAKNELN